MLLATGILAASCGGTTSAASTVAYGTGELSGVHCRTVGGMQLCGGLLPSPRGVTDQIVLERRTAAAGGVLSGDLVVKNSSGSVINLRDRSGCQPSYAVVLTGAHLDAAAGFSSVCISKPLVIPTGTTKFPVQVITTYQMCVQLDGSRPAGKAIRACTLTGPPPLPAGRYHAVLIGDHAALPPAAAAVTLTASP